MLGHPQCAAYVRDSFRNTTNIHPVSAQGFPHPCLQRVLYLASRQPILIFSNGSSPLARNHRKRTSVLSLGSSQVALSASTVMRPRLLLGQSAYVCGVAWDLDSFVSHPAPSKTADGRPHQGNLT